MPKHMYGFGRSSDKQLPNHMGYNSNSKFLPKTNNTASGLVKVVHVK